MMVSDGSVDNEQVDIVLSVAVGIIVVSGGEMLRSK